MSTLRKIVVPLVMFGIIGIQLVYTVAKLPEAWPFSNYPMFSKANARTTATNYPLQGVTSDGQTFEISTRKHLEPFNVAKLRIGLGGLVRIPDSTRRSESIANALAYLDQVYERNRLAGRHDGPAITELRLFRQSFDWTSTPIPDVEPTNEFLQSYRIGR